MPYRTDKIDTFDKGVIDELGDENIPASASSDSQNFKDLGDRIELMRGMQLVGDDNTANNKVLSIAKLTDVDGNEFLFKQVGTKLQRLNTSTDTWDDVQTTSLVADEELAFAPYRPPAGSFLYYSSPSSGLFRINAANPDDYVDLYDSSKNYKGRIITDSNRMWMWSILNNETLLRLSYIDNDWPYATNSSEVIDTGNGSDTNFSGTLNDDLVAGRTILITDTVETFTDDGNGNLEGDQGGSGTINYTTGAYDITFNSAPAGSQDIEATYDYEEPTSEGIADFTFTSPTRVAGEGLFFPQFEGNDPIQFVATYDGKQYVFHESSIWVVDLTDNDTDAINNLYRKNTGIPNWRAAVPTGDGIYYIDDTDNDDKQLRLLKYDKISTRVEPETISNQLDLDNYRFDEAAGVKYGDLIIFACKSTPEINHNDLLIIYNTKWEIFYKAFIPVNNFTIYDGELHCGSSVNGNVYKLFNGYLLDDAFIPAQWESNDYNLGTEGLKSFRRLIVEGDIAKAQTLKVEASYDGSGFVEIGEISGRGDYVDFTVGTEYGVSGYGTGSYGTGETVEAGRYFKRFKLNTPKFYRVKLRFKATGTGPVNVRMYRYDDIRIERKRSPSKFRVKA